MFNYTSEYIDNSVQFMMSQGVYPYSFKIF